MKKILSICIPTYNRPIILHKNLMALLESKSTNFEVIVYDNGSNQDYSLVKSLSIDSRLKYYRNEMNIGPVRNIIKSITAANGEFICLSSDEDLIEIDNIISEIQSVRVDSVDMLVGSFIEQNGKEIKLIDNFYTPNCKTFSELLFKFKYMSGLVFKKASINFKKIEVELEKPYYGKLNYYPHSFISNELISEGNINISSLLFFQKMYVGEPNIDSYFDFDYYHPKSLIANLENELKYIYDLEYLSKECFLNLIILRFNEFIMKLFYFYRDSSSSDNPAIYHFNTEKYRLVDQKKITIDSLIEAINLLFTYIDNLPRLHKVKLVFFLFLCKLIFLIVIKFYSIGFFDSKLGEFAKKIIVFFYTKINSI